MLHSLNAIPSSEFDPRTNYLVEENPFGLTPPPTWFLEELWKFDPLLVIFPSKEEAVYRMARRVEHGQGITTLVADPAKRRPDTTMFWKHRLVPVTSILPPPWVHWSHVLLRDLAARDIRRAGGYKKVSDTLDSQDDAAEAKWRDEVADGATIRARASWREQKWTRGEAVDLGARKVHGARTTRESKQFGPPRRALRPLDVNGSSSVLFTGRDEPLQGARPDFDLDERRETLIIRTA